MTIRLLFILLLLAIPLTGCDYGPMPDEGEEENILDDETAMDELWIQESALTTQNADPGLRADQRPDDNTTLVPGTSSALEDLDDGEECLTCDSLKKGASVHHGNPQPWDGDDDE